jgi:glycosyltransferase involved in cell wall biosynthesis
VSQGRRPRFTLTLLGWAGGLSGGDRHLLQMAAQWKEAAQVTILAPAAAASVVDEIAGDVRLEPLGSVRPSVRRFPPALAAEYLRRALVVSRRAASGTAVVVAGSHFLPDAAALARLARGGALGVVYVYHLVAARRTTDARALWSRADEAVSLALLRRSADLVFTSNAQTLDSLTDRGFVPLRTDVGIDLSRLRPTSLDRRPQRGLFVARMTRPKGVVDAVSAWAKVVRRVPDARLVMVGDGPERERGILLATKLGVAASIEWPGFVSEEEKVRLLSESRLFLAPSYEEGWGIAVCEALASKLPVVAYRLPVLDELFGNSYCAATLGGVDDLAARAVTVLEDDELAARFAAVGRCTAERYDVRRVAEAELEVILQRLHEHRT